MNVTCKIDIENDKVLICGSNGLVLGWICLDANDEPKLELVASRVGVGLTTVASISLDNLDIALDNWCQLMEMKRAKSRKSRKTVWNL